MKYRMLHRLNVYFIWVKLEINDYGRWNDIVSHVWVMWCGIDIGGINIFKIILYCYDLTLQTQKCQSSGSVSWSADKFRALKQKPVINEIIQLCVIRTLFEYGVHSRWKRWDSKLLANTSTFYMDNNECRRKQKWFVCIREIHLKF